MGEGPSGGVAAALVPPDLHPSPARGEGHQKLDLYTLSARTRGEGEEETGVWERG
jgi:hypothetical protein